MSKGLTARIRAEITKRPLSVDQLCKMLGEKSSAVSSMLSQMSDVLIYDHKPTRYASKQWRNEQLRNPRRPAQPPAPRINDFGFDEDIRVAQRRTIPMYHSNGWSRLL